MSGLSFIHSLTLSTLSISDAAPWSRDLTFHIPPYGKASESVEIAHFRFWNAVAYIIQQCTPNIICGKAGRSVHVTISSPVICAMWLQIKNCNCLKYTIRKKVILAEENRRRKEKTKLWEENAVGPAPVLGVSTPPCSEVKLRFAMFYSARQATPFSLFISP